MRLDSSVSGRMTILGVFRKDKLQHWTKRAQELRACSIAKIEKLEDKILVSYFLRDAKTLSSSHVGRDVPTSASGKGCWQKQRRAARRREALLRGVPLRSQMSGLSLRKYVPPTLG